MILVAKKVGCSFSRFLLHFLFKPLCPYHTPLTVSPPRIFPSSPSIKSQSSIHFIQWPILFLSPSFIFHAIFVFLACATFLRDEGNCSLALYTRDSTTKGQVGWSSSGSITTTFMEIYSVNISPIQEGHQSTERAILFIKYNQTIIKDPYMTINVVGGQLWPLHVELSRVFLQRNSIYTQKKDAIRLMSVILL